MPQLPPLARIAKLAGDHALAMQANVIANQRWTTKKDGSKVTDADLEANEIVCRELKIAFPGVAIVSEENSAEENAIAILADDRLESDPIDNTSGFAAGRDGWSVNIGRVINGVPEEGVVYFPQQKRLYFTDGGKAFLQIGDAAPKQVCVKKGPLRNPLRIAVGFNEQHIEHVEGRELELIKLPAQSRGCHVGIGECDLTGIGKGEGGGYNSYDVMGTAAFVRAADGEMMGLDKKPIRFPAGTTKVPDHFFGGIDNMVALGLAEPSLAKGDRPR